MKFSTLAVSVLSLGLAAVSAYPGSDMNVIEIRDTLEARDWDDVDQYFNRRDLDLRDNSDAEAIFMRELDPRYEFIDLEERGIIGEVADVVKLAVEGFTKLANEAKADKAHRAEFTKSVIAELEKKNPNMKYIICHVKHTYKFNGVQGQDWFHQHREFDVQIGGTIGYEIYGVGKGGTFHHDKDGGFLNWAYSSSIKRTGKNDLLIQ